MSARETVVTTELRWFVPGELPSEVDRWFGALTADLRPEVEARVDAYCWTGTADESRKWRDGRIERKMRQGVQRIALGRWHAFVELWRKAVTGERAQPPPSWIAAHKHRRQVHFAPGGPGGVLRMRPEAGDGADCALELAEVRIGGAPPVWTVGLEACGDDLPLVERVAVFVVERIPGAGALSASRCMGYPAWLLHHGPAVTRSAEAPS